MLDQDARRRTPGADDPRPLAGAVRSSNLADLCEETCKRHGAEPAIGLKLGGSWWWVAYVELLSHVEGFRGGLAHLGVGRGDAVAIVARNRFEWAVACYAVAGLGAVFVPVDEGRPEREWREILADSGPRVVIAGSEATAATLARMRAELPALAHVVGLALPPTDPHSYRALLDIGRRRPAARLSPAATDTASVVHAPTRTAIDHGTMIAHANALLARLDLTPDDRALAVRSWTAPAGQAELHALLATGCSLAIDDGTDPAADLAAIEPTVVFVAPDTLARASGIVEREMAARPRAVQALLRRGMAAAARRRCGEPIGWVDRRLARLADRLLPETVRRPFGGRLRYAVADETVPGARAAGDALGVTVRDPGRVS